MKRLTNILIGSLFLGIGMLAGLGVYGFFTARPAQAQIQAQSGYIFPRQSQLWSFSADGQNTWYDDGNGNTGHLLVVARDSVGRLPVLVTTHFLYGLLIQRLVNGGLQPVWIDGSPPPNPESTGFGKTIGVVLEPGSYLISSPHSMGGPSGKFLLLSGYWANP